MRLVINQPYIKRNKTIGNVLTILSMAVLVVGLLLAFSKDPTKIMWSWVCMIVGFILVRTGIYFSSRFVRSPRYDEILTQSFLKLRHDYTFYVYSTAVPMLLLGPNGIWLPMAVDSIGEVSYEKGKWKERGGGFLTKIFGQAGLGNPDRDAEEKKHDIQKFLLSKGFTPEELPEMKPILVVLLKKTAIGDVSNAPFPVWEVEDLKRLIRREDRQSTTDPLSEEMTERLKEAFGGQAIDMTGAEKLAGER